MVWFTGLSGAGKTTIANELDQLLIANNNHSYILDGDIFRSGLSSDLFFTKKDREENLRRIKYVAEMFCDSGIDFYCYILFLHFSRSTKARTLLGDCYVEVYVKASLETVEKGIQRVYKKGSVGGDTEFYGN